MTLLRQRMLEDLQIRLTCPPASVQHHNRNRPRGLSTTRWCESYFLIESNQNSNRAWNAIMRGELSPPSPTPSKPVGGEVVDVKAPKPICVDGLPGIPA